MAIWRWDEFQLGRISSAEFWADVGQRLGLNTEKLTEFRQAFWAGDRLDEELVALIRYLHGAGYRTALLSNAPADLYQELEQLGIADAFDVIVASGCEGLIKPDPAIFELTLARVGVAAEEAAFVDDFRVNVAAAEQVGLHATRFRGLSPLRKWLQELGVPVPNPILTPLPDVRAVIFDWGGVFEASPDEAHFAQWERRLTLESGTLRGILWGKVWHQLEAGAITNDDFMQRPFQPLPPFAAELTPRSRPATLSQTPLPFSVSLSGRRRLGCPQTFETLSSFDIALWLIDYFNLEPLLAAHIYLPSAKGQTPFHPVSMYLVRTYRRERNLSHHETVRILKSKEGCELRHRLGFEKEFPSESGLRYFENQITPELQWEINALQMDLLYQASLLPTRPDEEKKVSLSFDGMLHEARSRMRCAHVSESCYKEAPRPCPAQEKGKRGCDCTEPNCAQACHHSPPLLRPPRPAYRLLATTSTPRPVLSLP